MSVGENCLILQSFLSRDLGLNNPPRTGAQLASYTVDGMNSTVIHVNRYSKVENEFKVLRPLVTGIGPITYGEFLNLPETIAKVKRNAPGTFLIVGGIYPSLFPETTINIPGIDAIALGYGEKAWQAVTETVLSGRKVKNIQGVYTADEKIPPPGDRQYSQPIALKNLLQPNYSSLLPKIRTYFPESFMLARNQAIQGTRPNILGGIGCSDRCIFCINTAIQSRGNFGRQPVELRPPQLIVEETQILLTASGQKEIAVFLANPDSLTDADHFETIINLLDKIDPYKNILIGFDAKIKSLARLINRPGIANRLQNRIHFISLGAESLSQEILAYIGGKSFSIEELINCIHFCEKINAVPLVQVIIGLPPDTNKTLQESLDQLLFVRDSTPPFVLNTHFADPFPGTLLHDEALQLGLIDPDSEIVDFPTINISMETKILDRSEIVRWKHKFLGEFYTQDYYNRCNADSRGDLLFYQISHFYLD